MNDMVDAIERSFRKLLQTKRYRSIKVIDICEDACVSRKTFYAYFPDKEGIIDYVFKRDVLGPIRNFNELFTSEEAFPMSRTIQQKMYGAIHRDSEFWRNLVKPMKGHDDTFIRVVTNAIYELDMEVLERNGYRGDPVKADYISYFYSASQAMILQKWIYDDFKLSVEDLSELYVSMALSYWAELF